jgi:hypothetical protein
VEFNNKNLGFNKKCAFQQQNVALNQQKIVDSTVEMLEFSHQKMADFKRRGFQATKTVHWTKTGNFGVYQHFQTNPNVIFAKNPIENNEIPLNTHGKKKNTIFQHQNQLHHAKIASRPRHLWSIWWLQ